MNQILAILQKEWLELLKERGLIVSMLLPAIVFTSLPILALNLTSRPGSVETTRPETEETTTPAEENPMLKDMTEAEITQVDAGQSLSILLLFLPLFIPTVISAHSIIEEKTKRTLEPLLATPTKTSHLLIAKCFVALIPAVAITWVCGAIFSFSAYKLSITSEVFFALLSPGWVLLFVLCSPLMALLSVTVAIIISSRVRDTRTAHQLSSLLGVPLFIAFFGQLAGFVVLKPFFVLLTAIILFIVSGLALWLAVFLFQRETILTRWS